MSVASREVLLQAIIDKPDDDAPRLVYADWLEQGRQYDRAQFIRVQCRLAGLRDDDPQRAELEARERQLLENHADDWLGQLRDVLARPDFGPAFRFRRGFVEEIAISASNFIRHAEIFRVNPVRQVRLREAGAQMRGLAGSPNLARLTDLDMELWSDDVPFAIEDFQVLLSSPFLVALQGLSLFGADVGLRGIQALIAAPLLSRLKRLCLRACGLGNTIDVLTASPALRGLTTLDVSNNSLKLQGVQAVAACPYLVGLTSLGIGFTYAGEGAGQALASSPHLNSLEALYLSESDLGDPGIQAMAASPHLSGLPEIWLDDNGITAAGAQALAESSQFGRLTVLILFDNAIGDEGVRFLASSPTLTGLRRLCLGNCAITDAGAQALANSPALTSLKELGLWSTGHGLDNSIGDAGAQALALSTCLNRLDWLNVTGNPLSEQGKQALLHRFGTAAKCS